MSRSARTRFRDFVRKNQAQPLEPKAYEFARFRAHGMLCIVHQNQHGHVTAFNPSLAREAYDAWKANQRIDLSNPPAEPEVPVEEWHTVGRAGAALAERVKTGEAIDLEYEANAIGIKPDRLLRILAAHRCPEAAAISVTGGGLP